MGVHIHFRTPVWQKASSWMDSFSVKFNRLPVKDKKQVVVLFVLLSTMIYCGLLHWETNSVVSFSSIPPDLEFPLIYYDSINYIPLNELLDESFE
tara:strand:- start:187 stop:471 length:285 start_codon:yes stop_codon:yes gene_type:complete